MVSYTGKQVLVTGGLGFIGSNLVIRLVEAGAKVTVADSGVIGCGANRRNIDPVASDVEVLDFDIGDIDRARHLLKRTQCIFNLAGEVSHIHSMDFPERDLEINTRAQLRFLRECAQEAPGVRIVYGGTRQVYGTPEYLPVDERHPIVPVDFNGVHKYAATMYHLMLARTGRLDSVVLSLTNTYGPRMALDVPCQGVLPVFFRKLLLNKPIEIYGDGLQSRDPLYVDDAVEAFMLAGAIPVLPERVYNVGGPEVLSLAAIARSVCALASAKPPVHRRFPEELKKIDIGSFHTDCCRIARDLQWRAAIPFGEGARRTLEYFRSNLRHYLDATKGDPVCKLRERIETKPVSALAS